MDSGIFNLSNYNYQISESLIAQQLSSPRDSCRLLRLDRTKELIDEGIFKDIVDFFNQGDVLVLNNTKVIKARLLAQKKGGGKVEILLLKELKEGVWEVLVKPGKRARLNDCLVFAEDKLTARVSAITEQASRILEFNPRNIGNFLSQIGKVPTPPYIKREVIDLEDYQTVYAEKEGAVAAPTAGLHFTESLIKELANKGVIVAYVTLHCGLATFRPIKVGDIRNHIIEAECVEVSERVAKIVNAAKEKGKRVVAVGTTVVRSLESCSNPVAKDPFLISPFFGETNLYIIPGYTFKIVDALITNFHTPCSTNFVLVSSFCGLSLARQSYSYAKANNFKFYSFGDAMIIT